tara:strand:+ start:7006 stop:7257 length:252 start_codon:yes stop_codon:yes gene_type:complete
MKVNKKELLKIIREEIEAELTVEGGRPSWLPELPQVSVDTKQVQKDAKLALNKIYIAAKRGDTKAILKMLEQSWDLFSGFPGC